jgi:hypothetical protein
LLLLRTLTLCAFLPFTNCEGTLAAEGINHFDGEVLKPKRTISSRTRGPFNTIMPG